jgi:hypothetical protein
VRTLRAAPCRCGPQLGRPRAPTQRVDRSGPAAEELQGLFGARAGLGCVREQRQPRVGGEVQSVVAQVEVAAARLPLPIPGQAATPACVVKYTRPLALGACVDPDEPETGYVARRPRRISETAPACDGECRLISCQRPLRARALRSDAMGFAHPRTALHRLGAPAALVAAAVVLVLLAQAAQARTYVPDGSGHIRFKPRTFVGGSGVACGVFTAKRLHYTRYASRRARATGRVVVNTGEGGCAAGVMRTFDATYRLYRARHHCDIYGPDGWRRIRHRVFTRVDLIIPDEEWQQTGGQSPWRTTTEVRNC